MRVSPAKGRRGVRVMRSVLREPMMVIFGFGIFLGCGGGPWVGKVWEYWRVVCLPGG